MAIDLTLCDTFGDKILLRDTEEDWRENDSSGFSSGVKPISKVKGPSQKTNKLLGRDALGLNPCSCVDGLENVSVFPFKYGHLGSYVQFSGCRCLCSNLYTHRIHGTGIFISTYYLHVPLYKK